jgi:hypothetical protein
LAASWCGQAKHDFQSRAHHLSEPPLNIHTIETGWNSYIFFLLNSDTVNIISTFLFSFLFFFLQNISSCSNHPHQIWTKLSHNVLNPQVPHKWAHNLHLVKSRHLAVPGRHLCRQLLLCCYLSIWGYIGCQGLKSKAGYWV